MRQAGQESESAPGASSDLGHGGRASPSPSLSEYDYDEDDGGDELDEETFPSREPAQQPQPGFSGIVHEPTSASNTSGVPPKPKRTRQLTTPYQAAVLHELLAEVTIGQLFGVALLTKLAVTLPFNRKARRSR